MTDPSKILLTAASAGVTGTELAARLREEYSIETEAATPYGVLAMTGQGDTEESLTRFADALLSLDKTIVPKGSAIPEPPYQAEAPQKRFAPAEALRMKKEAVPVNAAVGRVSASYAAPYPPGVPVLAPGEIVGETEAEIIESCRLAGVRVPGAENGAIEVVAE